ncbi:zinc finger protein 395 [Nilaparvata lugens]|uniref:zinc finger protein 395 n=1 Tax=Nilaparvata lugens TaxID=108931 RepID=UPI00193DC756|nr:zinc finger protein 395 [Nilaparvata lugens]
MSLRRTLAHKAHRGSSRQTVTMSTGKRLAKRSIVGTRVVAPGEDGLLHCGVIQAVKSVADDQCGGGNRYTVRLESSRRTAVFRDCDLIGPGFGSVQGLTLQPGQRVFLTYNGREVAGNVKTHHTQSDEVVVEICPPGTEGAVELKKRLDEVRLLESRKSARLMDQDTDFARLADIGDRKRTSSHCIDVPAVHGSRKRRPSTSQDENVIGKEGESLMNECTAALVLMSLSCSPHSPSLNVWNGRVSPSPSLTDSWRSSTPSPPLSEGGWANTSTTDEGIVIDDDFDELPRKKKVSSTLKNYQFSMFLFIKCVIVTVIYLTSVQKKLLYSIVGSKRDRRRDDEGCMDDDHEEEFYYTEVESGLTSSPPTLSHRDMARPPHEDPEYQRILHQQMMVAQSAPLQHQLQPTSKPISVLAPVNGNHATALLSAQWSQGAPSPNSPQKYMRLSSSVPAKQPNSPTRKARGDTKKCRKVYGMEHREQWCTQCKWKKACTRFGD